MKSDIHSGSKYLGVLRRPYPSNNPTKDYPRALIEIEFMHNTTAMNRLGANFSQNLINFGESLTNALIESLAPWKRN